MGVGGGVMKFKSWVRGMCVSRNFFLSPVD